MTVIVLIRSNPKESHRPCEGIRIALGLAAGDHEVGVILMGEARLLLTPEVDEYIDGELTVKFLAGLTEFVPVFYVEEKGPGNDSPESDSVDLSDSEYPIERLSHEAIAERIAAAAHFVAF